MNFAEFLCALEPIEYPNCISCEPETSMARRRPKITANGHKHYQLQPKKKVDNDYNEYEYQPIQPIQPQSSQPVTEDSADDDNNQSQLRESYFQSKSIHHPKKNGYSTGSGLRSIAQGSADQASSAVSNQHAAAKQASYVAQNTLAQAAAQAAATAQVSAVKRLVSFSNNGRGFSA